MDITNAQYYKYINGDENVAINCTIDGKKVTVPLDPANRHYQAIQEWAKIDGNSIEDAD